MSNTYFQFKQFTVHQEKSAMKVCTDACLFGAWLAERIRSKKLMPRQILDIGAGTGLLSLMLAQATTASIDAVELDEQAAVQALENIESSPWHGRIQLIQGDARLVHLGKKYELIVSNPPFFDKDLKSPDQQRNLALHSSELVLSELVAIMQAHLTKNGHFAVLLPWHRRDEFVQLATGRGFFLREEMVVRQTSIHPPFRAMLLFAGDAVESIRSEIIIRENDRYSSNFTSLLADYYLHL